MIITSLFPSPDNPVKGIFVWQRVNKLLKANIDAEVFMPNPLLSKSNFLKVKEAYKINLENGPTTVRPINFYKIPRTFNFNDIAKKIAKIFYKENFDLIHFHYLIDALCLPELKKKHKIPCLVTAHGSDIHTYPFKGERQKNAVLNCLESADTVIFVSEFLKKTAENFGYTSESTVIPNGISPDFFKANQSKKTEYPIIGFVGNLIPVKRAECLPEIFLEIKKLLPQAQFLIVGDGNLRPEIEKKINTYALSESCQFTGRVASERIPGLMQKMSVLLLPSRKEGLGCVILEAQACGVPTTGSRQGGIPEAIGAFGTTVEEGPNFNLRFAEAAVKLIKNPLDAEKMKSHAKSMLWENTVSEEIELYKELIKNNPQSSS